MPTNEYLPFANGGGANVASQLDYSSNSGYSLGYQSGVAQSKYLNKTWRQSSVMTSMLAQFISDRTGLDVLDDGVVANLQAKFTTAVTGRLINVRIFSAPGAVVYTPTAGTTRVIVEVQGAGGAGTGTGAATSGQAAAAGGGGSGSYARAILFTGFSGVTITVGAGGIGASNAQGTVGAASSFGALVSAPGGGVNTSASPGQVPPAIQGAAPGGVAPVGGNINSCPGATGMYGLTVTGGVISGAGAPSFFGVGGAPIANTNSNGNPGVCAGSGGGGAITNPSGPAAAGGNGAPGLVIVWEYQ